MISVFFIVLGCAAALLLAIVFWLLWGGEDPSAPEVEALLTMNGMWIPGGTARQEADDSMFGHDAVAGFAAWPDRGEWPPAGRHCL